MPERRIVSDASTIIGLANLNSLSLLNRLYGEVLITSIVELEVSINLPKWVIVNVEYNDIAYRSLVPSLEAGEASSIALALNQKSALLIIDERKGRMRAQELGLAITGLIGIIVKSKQAGLIKSGKELLDRLVEQGFRLSPKLYNLALIKLGEE